MTFSIVVAADQNNGIGINGSLPWRIKGDMDYFKHITSKVYNEGHRNVVIMGRKTYESIPEKYRPLPDRINVIVTRNKEYNIDSPSVYVVHSLDEALELRDHIKEKVEDVFLIGGGELYKEGLKHPELLSVYLTRVQNAYNCDTHIDNIPEDMPMMFCQKCSENGIDYNFEFYKKVSCC